MTESKARRRTHVAWYNMHARCSAESKKHRTRYFDRGIKVCERWASFENFLADMGLCPLGLQLDRIKNDRGYEPSNCRWATRHEQQSNTRRNHLITFNGRTQTLTAWAREIGIPYATLAERLRRYGWTVEQALTRTQQRGKRP